MPAVEALSAQDAVAISKSDSTIVNIDALYVGTAGNVAVKTHKGTTVTFTAVPAGTVLPVKCERVMAATTAQDMVGLKY